MIQLISYSPWNESFNEGTLFDRCHKKDAQEISKLKSGDVFRVKSICDYKNEDDYEVYEYEYDGGEIERDGRKEYEFSKKEKTFSMKQNGKLVPSRFKVPVRNMRKI